MTDHIEMANPPKPRTMKEPRKDTLRHRAELAEAEAAFYMAAADDMVLMHTVHRLVVVAVLLGVLIGRVLL